MFLLLLALGDEETAGKLLGDLSEAGEFLGALALLAAEEVWGVGRLEAWIAIAVPLLVAWAVAVQRGQFARALTQELSRARFPDQRADPAEQAEGAHSRRLRDRIRIEQHARLIMYGADDPFCGAGEPYEPWSLSIELRPGRTSTARRPNRSTTAPSCGTSSRSWRRCACLPHGSPQIQAAVRDRLRELEIDEVVFLPVDGLPDRTAAPYTPEGFETHRSGSIEEGGETRRHFLRIRVGGWGERSSPPSSSASTRRAAC